MNKVKEQTYAFFGKELGQALLEKKQIVPHYWDNKTESYVPAAKWSHEDGHYCEKQDGNYEVLAVICGATSDINVLDVDDLPTVNEAGLDELLPSLPPYVLTRRGVHFYFHHQDSMPSVVKWYYGEKHVADYQSTAHLAKFTGQRKEGTCIFVDDWHEEAISAFDSLFSRSKTPHLPSSDMSETYEQVSMDELLCGKSYEWSSMSVYSYLEDKSVGKWKWMKDVEGKCDREITRMRKAGEGSRNVTLSNIAFNMIRIGGEHRLDDLLEAAQKAGLNMQEAQGAVDYAMANVTNERSRTLDERVATWGTMVKRNIRSGRNGVQHELVDAVSALAMYRHDYDPQFNIKRFVSRTGIAKGTVNAFRDELVRQGFLRVVKANKPNCPDNFHLCIRGTGIDKLTEQLDQLLDDEKIQIEWSDQPAIYEPSIMDFDPKLDNEIAGEGSRDHIETNSPKIYDWDEAQTQTQVVPNDDELSIEPTVEISASNDPAVEWWNYIVSQKPETQHLIDVDQNERAAHFDDELISGTLHNLTNDPIYRTKVNEWKAALINTLDNDKMMEYRRTLKAANRPGEIEEIFLIPERELSW